MCGEPGGTICWRGCEVDEDCGPDELCLCGSLLPLATTPAGICAKASCKTDADCEEGFNCSSYRVDDSLVAFSCQSIADECVGSDECEGYGGQAHGGGVNRACTSLGDRRGCAFVYCSP